MNETKSEIHLKNLLNALENEKQEDWKQFRNLFQHQTIDQRRTNGVTWYPIQIVSTEHYLGDSILVEIENKGKTIENHSFSSGKNIELFRNQADDTQSINATIKIVRGQRMKLIFPADELPDWVDEGKLGVNLLFDDLSYQEMERALKYLMEGSNKRANELLKIILNEKEAEFSGENKERLITGLNVSQMKAVQHCLNANDIALLHGPPGTGKTTTLVQAVRICLETEKQILICAPTNNAVDLLAEKLNEIGVKVLRLGNPARVSEEQLQLTIDGQIQEHVHFSEIKTLKRNAEEYFRMAGKYKRVFGKEEAQQRTLYYKEARACLSEARMLEDFISDQVLQNAQAIVCTPVIAAGKYLRQKKFKTLFLDEASQISEPMSWIPILKCERVIFAGDHFQLPPLVKSQKAEYLKRNLFERLIENENLGILLNVQYRMSNAIMGFANEYFYQNKLMADASVIDNSLQNNSEDPELSNSLEFIDTAGCGFEEEQNEETLSLLNPGEVKVLFAHLEKLTEKMRNNQLEQLEKLSCGIIAPYKAQIQYLQEEAEEFFASHNINLKTEIKTIDGFQGDEKDIIYVSLVRSNNKNEIGFLSELRRSNVAFTRARKKLVVIGDSSTLAVNDYYKKFIDYCEKSGSYRSAWEFIQ